MLVSFYFRDSHLEFYCKFSHKMQSVQACQWWHLWVFLLLISKCQWICYNVIFLFFFKFTYFQIYSLILLLSSGGWPCITKFYQKSPNWQRRKIWNKLIFQTDQRAEKCQFVIRTSELIAIKVIPLWKYWRRRQLQQYNTHSTRIIVRDREYSVAHI